MLVLRRILSRYSTRVVQSCSSHLTRNPDFVHSRCVSSLGLLHGGQRPTLKNGTYLKATMNYSVGNGEENDRSWRDVDTAEFVQLVLESTQDGVDRLIVDVREPEELVESGIIPGSINIPLGDVEDAFNSEADDFHERYSIPKPSADTDVVFFCRAGVRSLVAIEIANKLGYSKSRHYVRGYLGWEEHKEADQ